MNQKGFANIIIIGIVVAILLGVAGYFVLIQGPKIPSETEQAQPPAQGETETTQPPNQEGGVGGVTIIITSVTVLSPNGGEQWKLGEEYPIRWSYTSEGLTTVWIELLTETGSRVGFIATPELAGVSAPRTVSYPWRFKEIQTGRRDENTLIPEKVPLQPGKYLIRISSHITDYPGYPPTQIPNVTDTSDAPFTLIP